MSDPPKFKNPINVMCEGVANAGEIPEGECVAQRKIWKKN